MTTVYVVKTHNKHTGESEKEIVFYRNKRMYHGALFWKHEDEKAIGTRITRYLEEVVINCETEESEDLAAYDAYLDLCKKHGLEVFDSTLGSMKHWSFINGFTKILHRR